MRARRIVVRNTARVKWLKVLPWPVLALKQANPHRQNRHEITQLC
jgi:hypothetical protein